MPNVASQAQGRSREFRRPRTIDHGQFSTTSLGTRRNASNTQHVGNRRSATTSRNRMQPIDAAAATATAPARQPSHQHNSVDRPDPSSTLPDSQAFTPRRLDLASSLRSTSLRAIPGLQEPSHSLSPSREHILPADIGFSPTDNEHKHEGSSSGRQTSRSTRAQLRGEEGGADGAPSCRDSVLMQDFGEDRSYTTGGIFPSSASTGQLRAGRFPTGVMYVQVILLVQVVLLVLVIFLVRQLARVPVVGMGYDKNMPHNSTDRQATANACRTASRLPPKRHA